MAAQDSLFKLQSYQRTQQLIRDVNFENAFALPSAVGAENLKVPTQGHSNSWMINRVQDSIAKNDMTLAANALSDLTDILEYRAKNVGEKPESNPLYDFYRRLRDRAKSGQRVSWEELTNALNTFSADSENLTALQDTINNEKLNASRQGASEEEIDQSSTPLNYAEAQAPAQPTYNQPPPISLTPLSNTSLEQDRSEGNHDEQHTPHSPSPTRQASNSELPEQTQNKLNQANKSLQQSQGNPPPESPDQQSALDDKIDRFKKSMRRVQPSRETLLNSRTRKKAVASLLKTNATPGSGGILGAANNYLGFRDLINGGRWLADKLGFRGLSNFLGRFLAHENLIARALQGLWNLGASFTRAILDGLVRSIVPRAGLSALGGAGSTIGGWLAWGTGAAISLGPLLLLITLISGFLFFLWGIYDAESECGKSGTPSLTKTILNGETDTDGEKKFNLNDEIEYSIIVNYSLKCGGSIDAEVRDTLPSNLEYIPGSAISPTYNIQQQGGLNSPLTFEGLQENRTLIWRIKNLPNNRPFEITFKARPIQDNVWIVNEASGRFTVYPVGGSTPLNLTGPSRGLMCVEGLDERLLRIFEEAGVSANVSPSIIYAIAKAENGGRVPVYSLDGKKPPISPCGAHGLMQIQHINDGSGKNYGASCAEIGASPNPPEVWDGLSQKYNEISGGNIVDADSDKDSIFGAAFYIQERSWPNGKSYLDQLTDEEATKVAISYLGAGNRGYIAQTVNSYKDAYAKQGTCGGSVTGNEITAQPVQGGVNAQ